jgi:hypothetical protein
MCSAWFALGMHRGLVISADCLPWMWPWRGVLPATEPAAPTLTDPLLQFYPWQHLSRHELEAGRMPLWNPYQDGGVPLLGNGLVAIGSPLVWPTLMTDFATSWNYSLWLRICLAAVGTLVWLRIRGHSWPACLSGAAMVSLSGPFISWLEHPPTLTAAPVPLLLAAIEACRRWPSRPRLITVVGCTFLVIAGGHPETALMAAILAAVMALARATAGSIRACFAATVGALLAAPLWLPLVEYLAHSGAIGGLWRDHAVLPWRGLLRFIVPHAAVSDPIEGALTVSVTGLVLSLVGGFILWRRRQRGWILGAVVMILAAFDSPLAHWLPTVVPALWSRTVLLLPLVLAAAAAVGIDVLLDSLRRRDVTVLRRSLAVLIPAVIACELLLAAQGVHAIVNPSELNRTTPLIEWLQRDTSIHRVLFLDDMLPPNLATVYGIEDLRGYDAIWPRGWLERRDRDIGVFVHDMITLTSVQPRGLDAWNVAYLVALPDLPPVDQISDPSLRQRYEEVYRGRDGVIWRNRTCQPRARLAGGGDVQIVTHTPTRWQLEVAPTSADTLVIANPFFPGWQVRVDERRVLLHAAPGDPITIAVTAGRHQVDLVYRPASLTLGLVLALLGGITLGIWCVTMKPITSRDSAPPRDD